MMMDKLEKRKMILIFTFLAYIVVKLYLIEHSDYSRHDRYIVEHYPRMNLEKPIE